MKAFTALATLVAVAAAADKCEPLREKIPTCAIECLNNETTKHCKTNDIHCPCDPKNIANILKGASGCIKAACKTVVVDVPVKTFCKCEVANATPSKSSSAAKPTSTCDASKLQCAAKCVNAEAAKYCNPLTNNCACQPATIEKIIDATKDCIKKDCGSDLSPQIKSWCRCELGGSPSSSAKPTETSHSSSAKPTKSSQTSSRPSKTSSKSSSRNPSSSATQSSSSKPAASHSSSKPTGSHSSSTKPTGPHSSSSVAVSNSATSSTGQGGPTSSGQGVTLTSTITTYTTVCTITSCPATETACPIGSLTTSTVTEVTTWCPGETETAPPPGNGSPGPWSPPGSGGSGAPSTSGDSGSSSGSSGSSGSGGSEGSNGSPGSSGSGGSNGTPAAGGSEGSEGSGAPEGSGSSEGAAPTEVPVTAGAAQRLPDILAGALLVIGALVRL